MSMNSPDPSRPAAIPDAEPRKPSTFKRKVPWQLTAGSILLVISAAFMIFPSEDASVPSSAALAPLDPAVVDWPVYENASYGFRFSYPPALSTVEERSATSTRIYGPNAYMLNVRVNAAMPYDGLIALADPSPFTTRNGQAGEVSVGCVPDATIEAPCIFYTSIPFDVQGGSGAAIDLVTSLISRERATDPAFAGEFLHIARSFSAGTP